MLRLRMVWTKSCACRVACCDPGGSPGDDISATHLARLSIEWGLGHLGLETVAVHFLETVLLTAALFFGGRSVFLKLARFKRRRQGGREPLDRASVRRARTVGRLSPKVLEYEPPRPTSVLDHDER